MRFNQYILGRAKQEEMLNIVPPDEDETPPGIERRDFDDPKTPGAARHRASSDAKPAHQNTTEYNQTQNEQQRRDRAPVEIHTH
jgi:hypothetical protein